MVAPCGVTVTWNPAGGPGSGAALLPAGSFPAPARSPAAALASLDSAFSAALSAGVTWWLVTTLNAKKRKLAKM